MPVIQKIATLLANILRFHKKKVLITFCAAFLFAVVLFPYDDLADLVTAKVAAATQNQVFIQFDELGIALVPLFALQMEKVEVDTPFLPTLSADALTLAPSIASLLQFKMGFSAAAQGLFQGDLSLSARQGKKVGEEGNVRQLLVDADYSEFSLKSLKETLELPVNLEGRASVNLEATVDPSFNEQPEAETELSISQLRLPPSTVPTAFGPVSLPNLQFSKVNGKARLTASEFLIEELTLGGADEPLSGRLKGKVNVLFQMQGDRVVPIVGAYDIRMELNVRKAIENELSLFLGFLSRFKNPTPTGSRYAFRMTASRMGPPSDMQPISTF